MAGKETQDTLDIFDVAHGHPVAEEELDNLLRDGQLLTRAEERIRKLQEMYDDLFAQYKIKNLTAEEKPVYVVWQNTDLTEGRGRIIPIHVCESRTTAKRLGKKKDVQGMDAKVTEEKAIKIGQRWYGPVDVRKPSSEDVKQDNANERFDMVMKKAREAGLTEEDLAVLKELGDHK